MLIVQRGVRNHFNLTIDNVLFFGIQGDYDIPGKADIWACGTRAWYEICPSRAYKPIYVKMVEAAVMYFSFAAVVESRGPKQPTVEEFLLQYATDTGSGITLEQCKSKCKEYAPFLLNHCIQEEAVISWQVTKLWRFMHHECRHVLDALDNREKLRKKGISVPPISRRPTPPSRIKKRSPSHEPIMALNSRTNRIVPQIVENDMMDVDDSPQSEATNDLPSCQVDAQAVGLILDVLEDIWQEQGTKQRSNRITENTVKVKMFFKCRCTYQEPLILINYYAKSLVKAVDPKWEGSPFLDYLRKAARRPNPTLGRIPYEAVLKKVSRRKTASNRRHSGETSTTEKESPTSRSIPINRMRAKDTSSPYVAADIPVQQDEQSESKPRQVEDMPINTGKRGQPTRHQPQEPPKRQPQEPPKRRPQEPPKRRPQEPPKRQVQELPKRQPQELPNHQPQELPKRQPQGPPERQPQEPPKRQPQEPPKRQPQELPKRQPQEPPRRQPQEPPKRQPQEPPRHQPQEPARRQPQEPPKRQPQEPPKRQLQEPQVLPSPKPAGKTPRLRLVARKRGLPEEERAEPVDFSRLSKMVRTRISMPSAEGDSSNDDSSSLSPGDHTSNRVALSLIAAPVPEFDARGPESTWVCEEEGCGFVVRGADGPWAKEEVRAHIEDHGRYREDEKERLISYAVAEGQRGHLPVE